MGLCNSITHRYEGMPSFLTALRCPKLIVVVKKKMRAKLKRRSLLLLLLLLHKSHVFYFRSPLTPAGPGSKPDKGNARSAIYLPGASAALLQTLSFQSNKIHSGAPR